MKKSMQEFLAVWKNFWTEWEDSAQGKLYSCLPLISDMADEVIA